jgi:hypothetical protein
MIRNSEASKMRRHPHRDNGEASAGEAICPYCGQSISRKEFEQIRTRIESEERERIAGVEAGLRERFARERQEAAAKANAAIEKSRLEAAALVAKAKRDAASREAAIRQQATQAATAALAPKIDAAVNAEKHRAYAERLALTAQLDELKRRLEQRRANELGDEAEVNLFEALKREFAGDLISRVPKGRNGADILHDVVNQGGVVGRLVIDSKNHARWLTRFVSKAADDLRCNSSNLT